jgi:hypothetical protein
MSDAGRARRARVLVVLSVVAGLALLVIGVRFLTVPQAAARFFGIGGQPSSFDLHYVIALRDIWLALLLIVLALVRDWRGLALWLGLGALVCFGDSWIAAVSSGRAVSVAFHIASGIYWGALAAACWKEARRPAV